MAKLNAKKADIEARLAQPAAYEPAAKDNLRDLLADQAYVLRELGQLEHEWLEKQGQLEQLSA